MGTTEILAVHRQKLEGLLRKLGLWESLTRGELRCYECGVLISLDNIGFIIPSNKEILLCCSNMECLFKMKELKSEHNNET
jgi:hypothetical protein